MMCTIVLFLAIPTNRVFYFLNSVQVVLQVSVSCQSLCCFLFLSNPLSQISYHSFWTFIVRLRHSCCHFITISFSIILLLLFLSSYHFILSYTNKTMRRFSVLLLVDIMRYALHAFRNALLCTFSNISLYVMCHTILH